MKLNRRLIIFLLLVIAAGVFLYAYSKERLNQENPVNSDAQNIQKGISISFVGDILLASHVENKINQAGLNYPFEKVSSLLSTSDFTIGNLESAIGLGGTPSVNKEYTFRANPKVLEGVKWSGIDILSVANNHVLDYGTSAFYETLESIESVDLQYVGAGRNQAEAFKPVIQNKNGKKVVFFAASRVIPNGAWHAGQKWPGVAGIYDPNKLLKSMEGFNQDDIVVVYLHWGVEKESIPKPYQRKLARLLIDNGADVVIGSHPHVLQGFEFYRDGLIAYSLGNFVFTNIKNNSMILTVHFDDKGIESAEIVPCLIKNYRPEPLENEDDKLSFYRMIEDISFGVKINGGKLDRVHGDETKAKRKY